MDNRSIGIFDSGVGGIVVLSEIIKLLPNESFIYLGDTARFPYGSKSKENIIKYTKESIKFFKEKGVKAIVVACGTASSTLLEVLKENYDVPIIGVLEPVIKRLGNNEKIGVMATSRTINEKAWDRLINDYYPRTKIIGVSCPILAPLAETGWTNNEIAKLTIKEYLKEFKTENISKLILGCTHYPLFKDLIKEELAGVELIDLGEEVATYLKEFLTESEILNKDYGSTKYEIFLTDVDESYLKTFNNLLVNQSGIKDFEIKKTIL